MAVVVPTPTAIRTARRASGLTQREAAALIGYSARNFTRFERGRARMRAATWELLQQKLAGLSAEAVLREQLEAVAHRFRKELGGRRGERDLLAGGASTGTPTDFRAMLRLVLATCDPAPTPQDLAEWCGFSLDTVRSWLKPPSRRSARALPRHAMRLILWEAQARDRGGTNWAPAFAACR